MRNPNGYGSVKKLSGNRRRPYVFVVSEAGKRRVIRHLDGLPPTFGMRVT